MNQLATVLTLFLLAATGCGPSANGPQAPGSTSSQGREEPSGGATGGGSAATGEMGSGDSQVDENLVVGDDPCTVDADCRPASCCHAATCVAASGAPSCEDVMCTLECRRGTIDCGGGCRCFQGRCAARLVGTADLGIAVPR